MVFMTDFSSFVASYFLVNTTGSHDKVHQMGESRTTSGSGRVKIHTSPVFELKRGQKPPVMSLLPAIPVCGDIQVEFYNKSKVIKKVRLFRSFDRILI